MFRTALALLLALTCSPMFVASLHSSLTFDYVAAALPASAQLSAEKRTYSIRGTVVNSVTGDGIRGALVQTSSGRQRALLTGPDGRFQCDNLPAGPVWFNVQKPGYFAPQQIAPSAGQPMFTVGPDLPSITLKLVPEGVLHGRISGDGEPLESLQVHLLAERIESGRRVRSEQRSLPTNEDGEFRFGDLLPGKYFLFFGPSGGESFPAGALGPRAQGYGSVFYSSAPDLTSATSIEITPGKHDEIDVALSLRPFYRISGSVSGRFIGQGINVMILNAAGQNIAVSRVDLDRGTFQTQWVPPGAYVLRAFAFDNKTQQSFSALAPVTLTSDVSGLHLNLAPETNIPANVSIESTRGDAPAAGRVESTVAVSGFGDGNLRPNAVRAYVTLIPQDPVFSRMRHGSQPVKDDESGSLVIRNIPPGTYTVEINPVGPYYVASARSGFTDLLREPLTVAPGGSVQPIQVVLRDDFASVEGKVSYDAQADSGFVLAIPEEAAHRTQQMTTNKASGEYSFYSFHQLAPGSYKLCVLDRIDGFEYANPEVLRRYSSKMRDITLYPNQKASVDLELVRLGE
jgi:hypothetical protein